MITFIGRPVHLLNIQISNQPIVWQQSMDKNLRSRGSVVVQSKNKCDLCDFDCGMIVGARQGDWSISKTAVLLGFSCTIVLCPQMPQGGWGRKH